MRWTARALLGAAVLVAAAGCGTEPGGSAAPQASPAPPPVPAEPTRTPVNVNVGEALEVSDQQFKLLTAGNWAGAWALWTEMAKKSVPRADFLAVNKACPAALRKAYKLQDVRPVNTQLIELTYRRDDNVHRAVLRAAGGGWQFEPDAATLVEYANGVDAAIAKRKAEKQCT
ncbi:MAG TPA: hypothetical protein VFT95_13865 [Micromonosporaceae bacterium]|nr:hypothetical protein [Micromonosporaceae bacterium]